LQRCCLVKKKTTQTKKKRSIVGAGPGEQEEHELLHAAVGSDALEPHTEPPIPVDPMHALHGGPPHPSKTAKRKLR
jgi:hypothetical protein